MAIYRENKGPTTRTQISCFCNLAAAMVNQGDLAGAEPLLEEAANLALDGDEDTRELAFTQATLAHISARFRRLDAALELIRRALATLEKLGHRNIDLAHLLVAYGEILELRGESDQALAETQKAVDLYRELVAEDHMSLATAKAILARYLVESGDLDRAESLYRESLRTLEKQPGHPRHVLGLLAYGLFQTKRQKFRESEQTLATAVEQATENLELAARGQSERQQLAMSRQLRTVLDAYVGLSQLLPDLDEKAYGYLLRWKGAVFTRQRLQRLAARHAGSELLPQLESINSTLASLRVQTENAQERAAWQDKFDSLTEERDRLEFEISRQIPDFRRSSDTISLDQIQGSLPEGAALIDFFEVSRTTEDLVSGVPAHSNVNAFIVTRDEAVKAVDLGPAESVANVILQWRRVMVERAARRETEEVELVATALRRTVWDPLAAYVQDCSTVYVSPDGAIGLVPFSAIMNENGDYLVESKTFVGLPAPQALAWESQMTANESTAPDAPSMFILGDVDFGGGEPNTQNDRSRSGDWFDPLGETAAELETISRLFSSTHEAATIVKLSGADATEARFKETAGAQRYLHFATHGFFRSEDLSRTLRPAAFDSRSQSSEQDLLTMYHPGLLSGLALAGVNNRALHGPESGEAMAEDNLLYALEVAALDLSAARLVVVSACDTGLGQGTRGEGLLGLERAFHTAGAEATVTSLWKVDDRATSALMGLFYSNMWQHDMPRPEALRQAQLSLLQKRAVPVHPTGRESKERGLGQAVAREDARVDNFDAVDYSHPYYWAAWKISGFGP